MYPVKLGKTKKLRMQKEMLEITHFMDQSREGLDAKKKNANSNGLSKNKEIQQPTISTPE